jgi:hypothetical protein
LGNESVRALSKRRDKLKQRGLLWPIEQIGVWYLLRNAYGHSDVVKHTLDHVPKAYRVGILQPTMAADADAKG